MLLQHLQASKINQQSLAKFVGTFGNSLNFAWSYLICVVRAMRSAAHHFSSFLEFACSSTFAALSTRIRTSIPQSSPHLAFFALRQNSLRFPRLAIWISKPWKPVKGSSEICVTMKRLVADNFPLGKSHYPMLFDGSIGSCYNGRNWTTFQNVGQTFKNLRGIVIFKRLR